MPATQPAPSPGRHGQVLAPALRSGAAGSSPLHQPVLASTTATSPRCHFPLLQPTCLHMIAGSPRRELTRSSFFHCLLRKAAHLSPQGSEPRAFYWWLWDQFGMSLPLISDSGWRGPESLCPVVLLGLTLTDATRVLGEGWHCLASALLNPTSSSVPTRDDGTRGTVPKGRSGAVP